MLNSKCFLSGHDAFLDENYVNKIFTLEGNELGGEVTNNGDNGDRGIEEKAQELEAKIEH